MSTAIETRLDMVEQAFDSLKAPMLWIGSLAVSLPLSPPLEEACIPSARTLTDGIRRNLKG